MAEDGLGNDSPVSCRPCKGNRPHTVYVGEALLPWPVGWRQIVCQENSAKDHDQNDNEPFNVAVLHPLLIRAPRRFWLKVFQLSGSGASPPPLAQQGGRGSMELEESEGDGAQRTTRTKKQQR